MTTDVGRQLANLFARAETIAPQELAVSLRRLVDLLDPEPPRWTRKIDAARALGVTADVVRGRCRRKSSPVPTTWRDGRELVDLVALRREIEARRPRTTASGGDSAASA